MNPNKKVVHLQGIVLLPVIVGCRARLLCRGKVIWTSLVVAVYTQTEEMLCFETLNTNYCIKMAPSPQAASLLPTAAAA